MSAIGLVAAGLASLLLLLVGVGLRESGSGRTALVARPARSSLERLLARRNSRSGAPSMCTDFAPLGRAHPDASEPPGALLPPRRRIRAIGSTSFLWKDERIYVCTATSAPKVAALRERPQVAGVIDEGISSSDAKQLLIRGTAEVEIVDGVAPEYFEAAAKGGRGRPRRVRKGRPPGLRPAGADLDHSRMGAVL
jgi:hypothetical protein